jgi:hypothetical protein
VPPSLEFLLYVARRHDALAPCFVLNIWFCGRGQRRALDHTAKHEEQGRLTILVVSSKRLIYRYFLVGAPGLEPGTR